MNLSCDELYLCSDQLKSMAINSIPFLCISFREVKRFKGSEEISKQKIYEFPERLREPWLIWAGQKSLGTEQRMNSTWKMLSTEKIINYSL